MDFIISYGQRTFSSLWIRNYRLYFIGHGISMSGTWMQTVAFGWLVLLLTGSGTQLGLITAFQFIPMLVFGPYGGVIADRMDKRKLLFWSQSIGAVLAGALAVLIYFDIMPVWMLYVFALSFGIIRVFENPARQTFVSEIVGDENIKNAVSLNATVNNLARAIGPSIGGLLIATVGIAACFLFNALSYIAALTMLYQMRVEELNRVQPQEKKSGQLMEGLRYVLHQPTLRNILIMMAVIGTFAYEFQVSLPLLASQTFLGGASDYAALFASFGIGSVVGGLFAAGRHAITGRQLVISTMLFGVSIVGTALAPTLQIAVLGMAVVGAFSINVLSLANTMLQLGSAPEMRGRVMALWSVAMIGTTPIGGPIVGWVGEVFGARWSLALGGVAALSTAIFALLALARRRSGGTT